MMMMMMKKKKKMASTQLLPSCTAPTIAEEGAGQTLLLDTQLYRPKYSNHVEDYSSDCTSGDTEILTDSDEELGAQGGRPKQPKSAVYELWARRKRSAFSAPAPPSFIEGKREMDHPVAGFDQLPSDQATERATEFPASEGKVDEEWHSQESSPKRGSEMSNYSKEQLLGQKTPLCADISGYNLSEDIMYIPECDGKGNLKVSCTASSEEKSKNVSSVDTSAFLATSQALERTRTVSISPGIGDKQEGFHEIDAEIATELSGYHKEWSTAPLTSNKAADRGNHLEEDGPDVTAASKKKLKNISSVRASALRNTSSQAAKRTMMFDSLQNRNEKEDEFREIPFARELDVSDTYNRTWNLNPTYHKNQAQTEAEVVTSLQNPNHKEFGNAEESHIETSPSIDESRQLVVDMPPAGSETKKPVGRAKLMDTETIYTRTDERKAEFSDQGRKVRKLLFEDAEVGKKRLAHLQQAFANSGSEQRVELEKMQPVLEENPNGLEPTLRFKPSELSYLESYEPGEESEADALAMVDKLVSLDAPSLSEDPVAPKCDRYEGSSIRNRQQLAKVLETKSLQETFKVFDWIDSQTNEDGFIQKHQSGKSKFSDYFEVVESKGTGLPNKKLKKPVRQDTVARKKPGCLKGNQRVTKGVKGARRSGPPGAYTSNLSSKMMKWGDDDGKVPAVDVKKFDDPRSYGGKLSKKSMQGGLMQVASKLIENTLHESATAEKQSLDEIKVVDSAKKLDQVLQGSPHASRIPNACLPYSERGSDTQIGLEAIHIMGCSREADSQVRAGRVDTEKSLEGVLQTESKRITDGAKKTNRVSWSEDNEIASKEPPLMEKRLISSKIAKVYKAREVNRARFDGNLKTSEPKATTPESGRTTRSGKVGSLYSMEMTGPSKVKPKKKQPSSKASVGRVALRRSARLHPDSFEIKEGSTPQKNVKEKSHTTYTRFEKIDGGSLSANEDTKCTMKAAGSATKQKQPRIDSSTFDPVTIISDRNKKVRAVVSAKEHSDVVLHQQNVSTRARRALSNVSKLAASLSHPKASSSGRGFDEQKSPESLSTAVLPVGSPSDSVKLRRRASSRSQSLLASPLSKPIASRRSKRQSKSSKNQKLPGLPRTPILLTRIEFANAPSYPPEGKVKHLRKRNAPDMLLNTPSQSSAVSRDSNGNSIERKRRKRGPGNVNVLFSHGLSNEVVKQQKKILKRLGGKATRKAVECTHFVTDKFVRTGNMLEVMAAGKPVVTIAWLESCGLASYFVDEKNSVLQDPKKEKQLAFSMASTLAASQQKRLLQDWNVYVTPNTKPEGVRAIITAAGGKVLEDYESYISGEAGVTAFLVISCEEDYKLCLPFLCRGVKVYSPELLFSGIVGHRLDLLKNTLFIEQSAAKRGFKKK